MANLSEIFPVGAGGAGGLEPVFYTASTGTLAAEANRHYHLIMDTDLTITLGNITDERQVKFTYYDGPGNFTATFDVDASDALIVNGNPQTAGEDLTLETLGAFVQLTSDSSNNYWSVEAAATGGDYATATDASAGVVTLQSGATGATVADYEEVTFDLDSGFTGGNRTVTAVRMGKVVVLTGHGIATHSSSTFVTSSAGILPEAFRPSASDMRNCYFSTTASSQTVNILTNGTIQVIHEVAQGSTNTPINISYVIT